jgi:hypothetical protein
MLEIFIWNLMEAGLVLVVVLGGISGWLREFFRHS